MGSRIGMHNQEVREVAEHRAVEMRSFPSPLEERMMSILDDNGIAYEPQKVFYIYADDGWIMRYYIADFFLPGTNVIIEVDGSFHEGRRQYDKDRTKAIREHYPGVEVIRYTWDDLSDPEVVGEMLYMVG